MWTSRATSPRPSQSSRTRAGLDRVHEILQGFDPWPSWPICPLGPPTRDDAASAYVRNFGRVCRLRRTALPNADRGGLNHSSRALSSKERNPVQEPLGPSSTSTQADPLLSQAVKPASPPPYLNLGAGAWDATGPLTPIVLSETERRFMFRGLPQAGGAARRALREWERHFEPELFYDLSLCVSELVTKSVQHTLPGQDD